MSANKWRSTTSDYEIVNGITRLIPRAPLVPIEYSIVIRRQKDRTIERAIMGIWIASCVVVIASALIWLAKL